MLGEHPLTSKGQSEASAPAPQEVALKSLPAGLPLDQGTERAKLLAEPGVMAGAPLAQLSSLVGCANEHIPAWPVQGVLTPAERAQSCQAGVPLHPWAGPGQASCWTCRASGASGSCIQELRAAPPLTDTIPPVTGVRGTPVQPSPIGA